MPKSKPPPTLVSIASKVFANLALDRIRLLETHPQESLNDDFNEALQYYSSLPSMIVHQMIGKSIETYVSDCTSHSYADLVSITQYGYYVQDKCILPKLSSIYAFQVSQNQILVPLGFFI